MGAILPLLLSVLLAAPAAPGKVATRAPAASARLEAARAQLKTLMRDPVKRRYHHHWERAIRALQEAAVGKDAPAATLEAARARYALYRWSANEADRDAALRLARQAQKLGAGDAARFAAAVRREAGDDRPPPRARPSKPMVAGTPVRGGKPPVAAATPVTAVASPEPDPTPEPELEAAVADLKAPPALQLGSSNGAGTASIGEVKAWAGDDYTRVAISLDHWVGWQKLELPAAGATPRRLALDFRPAQLEGASRARSVSGEQIDRVRTAQHDADTVRVVLDLPGRDDVRFYRLDDPPRLVVDVGTRLAEREARSMAKGAVTPPGAAAVTAQTGEEEGRARTVRKVVIDAGHGGIDPGAVGPTGVREKDVTLAISRRLAKRLQEAGFEVVMTRSDDRFVALEERTAIANARRGDLFVSIHANANPRRSLSGVESWVLNVADDRYASRLAARENGVGPDEEVAASDARRILSDLDARSATDASRRLALQVQREITGAVREKVGEVQDLGVKSALFYVLVGARMPAILVETAFISNRREERWLASARFQDEVSGALARAVVAFAAQQDPRLARAH